MVRRARAGPLPRAAVDCALSIRLYSSFVSIPHQEHSVRIRQKEIRRSRKRLEDRVKARIKTLRKPVAASAPAAKPRTRRKPVTPPEVVASQAQSE
jgi:hypothetical protein